MASSNLAAEAVDLTRSYRAGSHDVRALDRVSLAVGSGEIVAVMGPSGSGKSTLVYLLAGLDTPDAGSARVTGVDWASLRGAARARFRRRTCGFVAQGLSLLPQATAAENVEVPLLLDGVDAGERAARVTAALERVGLREHALKLPDQLSGGEQQRVAIARALVTGPALVLADEPTGSLDSATSEAVTRLLTSAAREQGTAIVLVTHDPAVARHAQRIVTLHSGRIDGDDAAPRHMRAVR
jgi:ABC-type lipoprotein export system ATPase subunit